MRTIILRWLATIVLAFGTSPLSAAEPAGLRDPEQILFEGVLKVAEKDVRAALRNDFDAVLAGHPDGELSGYLRAVETTIQLGYRHSGFPKAKVAAEYDEERGRIIVHAEEGDRHFCGDIVITGAKLVDTGLLAESLREPAKDDNTPWVPGRPAPFDDAAAREIIKRLQGAFAAQGFFQSQFDFRIATEPSESAAKLEIEVSDEGPRAKIGKITIAGNERDSDAEILQYLQLRPGQRYDAGLAQRLQAHLEDSGRFLGSHITSAAPRQSLEGPEIVDLNLEIRDYVPSSPLAADFSAEEKALLQFGDWAERWSRGETDHDLVFDASIRAGELEQMCAEMELPVPPTLWAGIRRIEARMVQSAKQGQVVTLRFVGGDERVVFEEVYSFSPGRLLIGSPRRNAKLELLLANTRLKLNWQADTAPFDKLDDSKDNFRLLFGFTFDNQGKDEPSPLTVTTSFKPAALLSFLHRDESTSVLNNGVWHLRDDHLRFKIDADTGRLIEAQIEAKERDRAEPRTGRLTVRTEAGAYAAEWRRVESQLSAAKDCDGTKAWKSLFQFAFDEWAYSLQQLDAPAERIACCAALQKLVQRWSPPWPFPTDKGKDKDDKLAFKLPPEKTTYHFPDLFSLDAASLQKCIPQWLVIYRELVPRDSWYGPVGRDLLLTRASPSFVPVGSLLKATHSSRLGPIGQLAVAYTRHPALQNTAVDAGVKLLSVESFRKDYEPLLSGDGLLSKYILTLADAIRSLDEEELRSLTILVPENRVPRSLAAGALLSLKDEPDEPVAESVSRLFKLAWNVSLRNWTASRLQILGPKTPRSTAGPWSTLSTKQNKEHSDSAGAKITTGIQPASTDKLDALEKLAEELQKSDVPKAEKPAEREPVSITERLDRLRKEEEKKK